MKRDLSQIKNIQDVQVAMAEELHNLLGVNVEVTFYGKDDEFSVATENPEDAEKVRRFFSKYGKIQYLSSAPIDDDDPDYRVDYYK